MNKKYYISLLGILMLCVLFVYMGCKKDENTVTGPNQNGPFYPVTATVLGPSGAPQGGATLALQNPPSSDSLFSTITDSAGKGTIQAPSGQQVIIAKMGTVFQATMTVNVIASSTPTIISTPLHLQQNTSLGKTLVIFAGCEEIEEVLADTSIAYTTFDNTTVDSMRAQTRDTVALLNYLKKYAIVFSDCNCGDEDGYPILARLYGRYVQQGGKIYGGHYNYMNLQYIFPGYYQNEVYGYGDSLKILNANLQTACGYNVIQFDASYYEQFSDLPPSSIVYAVMTSSPGSTSSPQGIPLIVENHLGNW